MSVVRKPLRWFVPSKKEVLNTPEDVRSEIGFKLHLLQIGEDGDDPDIKAFGEDNRIRHLTKIVTRGEDSNTYRTSVAAEFPEGLWVIDVFNKKSTSGISTPQKDIDRIVARYKRLKAFRETPEGKLIIQEMNNELLQEKKRVMSASFRTRQIR